MLSSRAYVSRHEDPALKGRAIGRKPLRGCGKYLITYVRLLRAVKACKGTCYAAKGRHSAYWTAGRGVDFSTKSRKASAGTL